MPTHSGPILIIILLGLLFFTPLVLQPDAVLYSDYSDFINYHIPVKRFLVLKKYYFPVGLSAKLKTDAHLRHLRPPNDSSLFIHNTISRCAPNAYAAFPNVWEQYVTVGIVKKILH